MKVHFTTTVDEKILEEFKQLTKLNAVNRSKLIENFLSSWNTKIKSSQS